MELLSSEMDESFLTEIHVVWRQRSGYKNLMNVSLEVKLTALFTLGIFQV